MINKIKSYFAKKVETIEFENVTIAGHDFRIIPATKLPNLRRTKFFLDEYTREWGLSKPELLAYIALAIKETDADYTNEDKVKRIYALLTTLESVIKEDYQYKPFLLAACNYILLPGEDPFKIEPKYNQQKMKLCKEIPEVEAFFLTNIRVLQLRMQGLSDMSAVLDSPLSKMHKHMENQVLSKINSTIYEIGNS